ncbi:MAG: hypothetical protein WC787_05000 [Patescibacteria group bacterium]
MPRIIAIPIFLLPWIVAICVVGWIVLNRFPPNGHFVAVTTFAKSNAFINPFLPSERVSVPGKQPDGWTGQRITGDPTYMTARVPGPYERVDVELEFRAVHQPLIEFGIVKDAEGKDLDLEPLFFEGLMTDEWKKTNGGYVRNAMNATRLLSGAPEGIATWDATATVALLEDPGGDARETKVSLRGAHDVYVVPAGGNIDVTFGLQDVNRKRGNTTAVFRVFRGDEEIFREALGTSGSRDTRMGEVFEFRVFIPKVRPGAYRISFQSDDDVFIRSIKTTSRRWVVGPRLNFGDVVGYATSTMAGHAWTTSRHIVAETFHTEGLQTLTLGPASVRVTKTHETYRLDRTDAETRPIELVAPQGDLRIVGDGWFALRVDAFFEPKPKRLTDGTNVDLERVDGVITDFEKPEPIGEGWYRSQKTFMIDPSLDRLRFVLSAPGIMSRAGGVDIRRIKLTYRRDPITLSGWTMLLKQELINAWRRL